MYTPTTEDIIFAKSIYDEIIWTQTLNPNAIMAAHQRLFGYAADTKQQAKIKLFAWFNYTFKAEMLGVDKTETADINQPSVTIDNPSHSEDKQQVLDEVNGKILSRIADLELELSKCEDSQEIRSLKQRITIAKKKLQ